MYAVFRTGGKQYRAQEGQRLKLERLDAGVGDTVEFDQVLLIADGENTTIGAPFIDGGKVTGTVTSHGRAKKIEVVKFRRRKHHRKQMGHRQYFTEVEITGIQAG